ncbi:hypothetical protein BH11ARM2_BH11ARM2_23350 [soil metagenome]
MGEGAHRCTADKAEPEEGVREPGAARTAVRDGGEALAQFDQGAGHVGEADTDLALAVKDRVLRAHRQEQGDDAEAGMSQGVQPRRYGEKKGDEQQDRRTTPVIRAVTQERAEDDTSNEQRHDAAGKQSSAEPTLPDGDSRAGGIATHKGDKKVARGQEAEGVDVAREGRQRDGKGDGAAVVVDHLGGRRPPSPARMLCRTGH